MAKQTIDIGSTANDGTGDDLRTGGDKINDNFDELYAREEMASGDAAKLALIEDEADVTDAANVAAAGAAMAADLASTASGEGASLIAVRDADGNFTGTDVEAVLAELQGSIDGVSAGGISDGDKGDITVSSSGTVWTLDDDAVTIAKIAAAARSGSDTTMVTGTAGTNGYSAVWNDDGDLVEGPELVDSGDLTENETPTSGDRLLALASGGGFVYVDVGNLPSGSGSGDLVDDTSPQLGGDLDANGNDIDMGTNVITDTAVGQWITAYSWGDHASGGYAASTTLAATGGADLIGVDNSGGDFTGATVQEALESLAAQVVALSGNLVPDAFVIGDWSIADATTGGDATVTISSLPDENGATITDVEYQIDAGSWVSSGGTSTFTISDGFTDGVESDVILRAVNQFGAGSDGDTKTVTTSTVDVTAPTLTSPTGSADGSTGATSIGVTTNEGNGTLYWGIYPTASTPTAAAIVAGTGAVENGSQTVSSSGAQTVSDQSGLTASTAYKVHFVHDDAASNRSSIATSAEFTTTAGGSIVSSAVLQLEADNTTFSASQWDDEKSTGISLTQSGSLGLPTLVSDASLQESYLSFEGSTNLGLDDDDIGSSGLPSGNSARTMAVVMRLGSGKENYQGVMYGDNADDEAFGVAYHGSTAAAQVDVWGDGAAGVTAIDDDDWHILLVTYDGTDGALYVDNSADGTPSSLTPLSTGGVVKLVFVNT